MKGGGGILGRRKSVCEDAESMRNGTCNKSQVASVVERLSKRERETGCGEMRRLGLDGGGL